MSGPDPACAPGREEKHVELHHAINEIGSVTDKAQKLHSRIMDSNEKGNKKGQPESPLCPLPPLVVLLDEGPKRVREQISMLHDVLNNIQSALF